MSNLCESVSVKHVML